MDRRRKWTPAPPAEGRRHRPDHIMVVAATFLIGLGMVLLVAISPALTAQNGVGGSYYIFRQFIAMLIGFALFFIVSRMDMRMLKAIRWPLVFLSAAAAAAVLLISGLAFRWIQIGGLSFQPAELVKFTIVIFGGLYLADRIERGEIASTEKTLRPVGYWMGLTAFVVVILERDLGSMMVMSAIMIAMLFMAGLPFRMLGIIAVLLVVAVVFFISIQGYRRDRFTTFLNPERDCTSEGYHACQALIAVGSGGILGLGLGNSIQAYGYLPEASNDSIFAIYAEKFGFIGSLVLLGLYGLLFSRILNVIRRAPDNASRMIATGVFGWLVSQTIVNIGAMIGLLPLKGITLPFISYGGTSLMFVLAALGLVYRISARTVIRRSLTNKVPVRVGA